MSDKRITRAKAIRLKCLDCSAGQQTEVRECSIKTCALWRYRMGTEERDQLYYSRRKMLKTSVAKDYQWRIENKEGSDD